MSESPPHSPHNGQMEVGGTPRKKLLSQAAENEIQQRRSYSLQGILNPERKGKLFEHFVVTGLPPQLAVSTHISPPHSLPVSQRVANGSHTSSHAMNSDQWERYTPEILFCYPPSERVKKLLVPQFTFPEGMSSENVQRLATELEMNQLVFAPLSTVEESNSSFVFLLTGEDSLLYGVCVIHKELLRDELSFAPIKAGTTSSSESSSDENGSDVPPSSTVSTEGYIVAPRCYMFLTHFPFFSTHFQVLYSILALERTHRMFSKMSGSDFRATGVSEVLQLLEQYRAFDVPKDEAELKVILPEETLQFTIPSGDDDVQLIDYCMSCLVKLTPLDVLLQILTAILQECQVIILSCQTSLISALCMGLVPLMRPYVWQGTFIPVLPISLEECVHSPMPYIMGVTKLPEDAIQDLQDVLIWDVDNNHWINRPNDLVPLPYPSSLRERLEPLHHLLYKTADADRRRAILQPYANSPQETEICHGIISVLRQYHKDMHHTILRAMNTISNFNISKPRHLTKLLVEVGDDNYTAFLKRFLSSQHWHFFYDKMKLGDDSLFELKSTSNPTSLVTSGQLESSESSSESLNADSSSSSFEPLLKSSSTLFGMGHSGIQVIAAVSDAFDTSLDDFSIDDQDDDEELSVP